MRTPLNVAGRWAARLSLALLTAAPLAGSFPSGVRAAEPGDDFGRLRKAPGTCRANLAEAPAAVCTSIQLEQRARGSLSIRFFLPEAGAVSHQLTFAGVLTPGSQPLQCRQGRCRLQGPIETEIGSISESGFDGRGLATSLPKAWPVRGRCKVEQLQLSCEGTSFSGERWQAQASF